MKKLFVISITVFLFSLASWIISPIPMVYAVEPTPVTVTNPVTINPPPAPDMPNNISISGITDIGATVSWSPVATASQYSVWVNGARWAGADSPGVEITGLQPNTSYDVYVTAANDGGESGPSSTLSFSTLPPVPTVPPNPTVSNVTGNSALVHWEPLPPWQYIQAYRVYVDGTAVADVTPQAGTQAANLTNLAAGNHVVSVSGINANREGVPSQSTQFTIQAVPSVTGIKMTNHSPDTIWFRWDASPDADKNIIYVDGQPVGETRQTEYVLSGLQAGQSFQVGVVAVMLNGNRSQISTIQLRTLPATATVTKDSFIQAIYSYVPDVFPGLIVIFAVGAAFAVASAARETFKGRLFRIIRR